MYFCYINGNAEDICVHARMSFYNDLNVQPIDLSMLANQDLKEMTVIC